MLSPLMSTHDFNKYKKSKLVLKDLEELVAKYKVMIAELEKFKHYASVKDTLMCLKDNRTMLEIHLNEQNRIYQNKGQF